MDDELTSVGRAGAQVHKRGNGFTLIELLVVIAIIGILASLLLPSLAKAKETAKLSLERSNMRQVGVAIAMYADDFNSRLPGANNSRQRDHSVVRSRLAPAYIQINRDLWGCPSTYNRGWSTAQWASTWWWNAGWGGSLDVNGKNLTNDKICKAGNPPDCGLTWADGFNLFIDGRGFGTKRVPDEVVIITDSGGLPASWTRGIAPCSNHPPPGNVLGKPLGSNSLCLSTRVIWRPTAVLNSTWDGGANTWR